MKRKDGVRTAQKMGDDILESRQPNPLATQYSAIVQSSHDAIFSKTLDGIVTSWNKGAEEVYGYRADEMLGRSIAVIFPPEKLDELDRMLEGVRRGERIRSYETVRLHKDQTRIIVELTVSPLDCESGGLTGVSVIAHDITDRKQAAQEIAFQASLLEQVHNGIIVIDFNNKILYWNKFAEHLYQWKSEEALGKNIIDLLSPEESKEEVSDNFNYLYQEGHWEGDFNVRRKDGSKIFAHITNTYLKDLEGKNIGFIGISVDATLRKNVVDVLRESESKFKNLVWNMQVGVLLQGPGAEIFLSNPKALEFLGLSEDQLLGKTSFDPDWNVIHEDGSPFPGETHPVPRAIASARPVLNVIMGVYRPATNDRIWLLVDAVPELNEDGEVEEVVCTFIDITERKQMEEKLKYMSIHDALTGLYNRAFFDEELALLEPGQQFPVSFVMADVDRLKLVNDSQGHQAGDNLLKQTARILSTAFRGGDIVARIGGDEFVAILPGTDAGTADKVLLRVRQRLQNYNEGQGSQPISISFGVSTADNAGTIWDALKQADEKMYQEKRAQAPEPGNKAGN